MLKDILRIAGRGDRATVAEHDNIGPHAHCCVAHCLYALGSLLKRERRVRADRAAGGQAHMRHQHVGPGLGHRRSLSGVEDIRAGQHAQPVGLANHIDLQAVAHAGLLKVGPKAAVEQADGREVLHPIEAHSLNLAQEDRHEPKGVGATDPGQHQGALNDRQHLAGHIDHNRVGVAVGQHPGQAAPPGHAVAPRVIDDDQVGPALLGELGRDAGARARAKQRRSGGDLGAQPL